MAYEPVDLSAFTPFSGKDIGVVFGIIKTGLELSGTVDGTNDDFVFPESAEPFYDVNLDGKVDKDDITVFVDGVAVEVTSFDEETRTAALASAPALGKVVTGACTSEFEPYIAQNVEFSPEYEKQTFNRLRSALKRTSYPSFELLIKGELLAADFETIKLAFTDDEPQELNDEPKMIRAYLIADSRTADEDNRVLAIDSGRLVFPSLLNAQAGTDFATSSFEISVDSMPKLLEFAPAVEEGEGEGGT